MRICINNGIDSALPAVVVYEGVLHNCKEPRLQVGVALEAISILKSLVKGLLNKVICLVAICGQQVCISA